MTVEEYSSTQRRKKKDRNKKTRKGHLVLGEESSSKQQKLKKNENKKQKRRHHDSVNDAPTKSLSKLLHKNVKAEKPAKLQDSSETQISTLRKMVDPETAKYFSEIANLFGSNEIDLEERSAICGHALEETTGKEVELATDMVISHTLQNLLEWCDLDGLCAFLRNCAREFPTIAIDKFGSHVIETALRSLATHLQDEGSYSYIEDTLTKICKVVAVYAANVMCSRYGSHVLRSLLCLCKGVPLDSLEEFHVTKPSAVLAERLNSKSAYSSGTNPKNFQHGFTVLFKSFVREMLNHSKDEIATLRVNKYSSFVLQTALKLSTGDDQELLHAILVVLGHHEENNGEENIIDDATKQEIMVLLEDTASSHLLEVIIGVAPETLYNELLTKVFKGSLFEISSHQYGNFVVQALVSSVKTRDQMDLIWVELGPKFREVLESGKSGVVASILAACLRLQTHAHECCQALAEAVSSDSEPSIFIIPHVLFLENYFRDCTSWEWPLGNKMHILGCLMLQTIFKYPSQFIQPFITSITSMDADHIFQSAKDAGGSHVLEAFLSSDASAKLKHKVVTKLRDHYGELALNPSSSFTVEKCFNASDISMKETIAAELLAVQAELSKAKHGPYLLKKLDIDTFARNPEQWKLNQAAKESAYREFQAAFGSSSRPCEDNIEVLQSSLKSSKKNHKSYQKKCNNFDHNRIASNAMASSSTEFSALEHRRGLKRRVTADENDVNQPASKNFVRNNSVTQFVRKSGKRKSSATEFADLAGKATLSAYEARVLFKPAKNEKKGPGEERVPALKKRKR